MLPPLMRRHGNQKQEISKIEVESKPALEEKVLVTESEEVKIAEPGFYDSLLLSITSLWSSNPGKKEDIVDIFSAPPISEHEGFCEKVGPNECPNSKIIHSSSVEYETCNFPKNVLSSATQTILDNINILAVTAMLVLSFLSLYYLITV
uniref:Uncharacterized protein n=1 Tax=Megaselia scalaris TaxID=36166 RepID=T1GCC4_MEGSC